MHKGQKMPEELKRLHSLKMKGRYVKENNPFFGKKHSEETKQKMKGKHMKNAPVYGSLHDYIKYYKPKPEKCSMCDEVKKLDLANKSQEYKRDLDDWEWLCRRCHMKKDGRLKKLIDRNLGVI